MLKERLSEDLKDAMRARDPVRVRTIRALRAALLEKEIEERVGGEAALSEAQETAVVQKQAKQRRDSIDQFESAGRSDLVAKEREELEVIEAYLPQQLGDDEIRRVLDEVVRATGAASLRDLGRVMGAAMQRMQGRADGKRINAIARSLLSDDAPS